MDKTKPPSYNVIPLTNRYDFIAPQDMNNILEDLNDMGYLSEEGTKFWREHWKLFIRK